MWKCHYQRRFEELPAYGADLPSERAGLDRAALLHVEALESSESQENTSVEKRQLELQLGLGWHLRATVLRSELSKSGAAHHGAMECSQGRVLALGWDAFLPHVLCQ